MKYRFLETSRGKWLPFGLYIVPLLFTFGLSISYWNHNVTYMRMTITSSEQLDSVRFYAGGIFDQILLLALLLDGYCYIVINRSIRGLRKLIVPSIDTYIALSICTIIETIIFIKYHYERAAALGYPLIYRDVSFQIHLSVIMLIVYLMNILLLLVVYLVSRLKTAFYKNN